MEEGRGCGGGGGAEKFSRADGNTEVECSGQEIALGDVFPPAKPHLLKLLDLFEIAQPTGSQASCLQHFGGRLHTQTMAPPKETPKGIDNLCNTHESHRIWFHLASLTHAE